MATYGSVTTEITRKFDEVFEESNFDESLYLTKKIYKHSDELSFSYRYAFRTYDMEDGNYATELLMVLEPSSLCAAKRKEITKCACIEESEITIEDAIDVLICEAIPFATETVPFEKLEEAKDTVASALPCFDMMRGFSLDRCVNRIGVTGWDLIKEAKGRVKDAFKYALKRYA